METFLTLTRGEGYTMDIEYRKLTKKELNMFIDIRIAQLREEGAQEDIDLRPYLEDDYE